MFTIFKKINQLPLSFEQDSYRKHTTTTCDIRLHAHLMAIIIYFGNFSRTTQEMHVPMEKKVCVCVCGSYMKERVWYVLIHSFCFRSFHQIAKVTMKNNKHAYEGVWSNLSQRIKMLPQGILNDNRRESTENPKFEVRINDARQKKMCRILCPLLVLCSY